MSFFAYNADKMTFPIQQAKSLKLDFDKTNSAYSNNYNDIYFQPSIGLEEKKHVFLKGNNLPNNWHDKESFTIAETGFGTGLNFLATLQLWQQTRRANQQLHYVSCELHPLNRQQLKQALQNLSEIKHYSTILIDNYPKHLFYGFHRIHFNDFNLSLTLIIGDCVDAFSQLEAHVDAWYLDGFAPSKNEQMWSEKLFNAIAKLSHKDTTVATYTVARKIRDGLKNIGFIVEKTIGFGQKREMLTATLESINKTTEKQPWATTFASSNCDSITILGAGIAGISLADKLIHQGKNITLIDRQQRPCMETSGNPQAMVMPSLTLNDSIEARFYLSAFLYACNYYNRANYHQVGVHQLAFNKKQQNWQDKLLTNFDFPSELVRKHQDGILYSTAGWLDTQGQAGSIVAKIDNYLQAEIDKISYHDNNWQLYNKGKIVHTSKTLILANGINALKLLPNYNLPISPKYGQISYIKSAEIDPQISDCPHIQLNQGYITPSWHGTQTLGATFEHISKEKWYETQKEKKDHWRKNTGLWQKTPYENYFNDTTSYKSRAGIRVTTPDHMPICGAVINQKQFQKDYHDIRHGKQFKQYPIPKTSKNLYLFTGLGSRGFTSAPLLAEFLSNQILNQPQALNKQLQKAINPNRFLYKSLKRQ